MPYNQNIPQATDQLTQSQLDLLNNFIAINNWVNVNHGAFNGANSGFHEFVTFTDRTGNQPIFNGFSGMYSFNYNITNKQEIWINTQEVNPLNSQQYPMTASVLRNVAAPGFFSRGWTYLPSGIILKWGRDASAAAVNLNGVAGEPNFTQVFSILSTPSNGGVPTTTSYSLNNATFVMSVYSGAGGQVSWLVIGY